MSSRPETATAPAPIVIDPALFREDAISEETRLLNESVEEMLASMPTIMEIGPEAVRARRVEGTGPLAMEPAHPIARWETASQPGRENVQVRVFEPEGTLNGIYLHIHGGGHTLGSAGAQDQTLGKLAERLSVGVVSVEYRLAPENPWPIPADDCETAALWLIEQAKTLFGTDKIVIGGDSAGAHLCATTILRLRDQHNMTPFAGANLIYGVYDMGGLPAVQNWGPRNLILNTEIVFYFRDQLLPPSQFAPSRWRDPEISPLYKSLHGLCPALFTVGTMDPLIDDNILMASRWLAAGNVSELAIYPGGIHVFDRFENLPIATLANARMDRFIENCLDG